MTPDTHNQASCYYYQLTFTVPAEFVLAFSEGLQDIASSISYCDLPQSEKWQIEAIHFEPFNTEAVQSSLDTLSTQLDIPAPRFEIHKKEQQDWLKQNRESFPALEIGAFYIHGSHLKPSSNSELKSLKIDASVAFGTGSHETTKGCIHALESLKQQGHAFKNILDIGTGTGILAMASAHLFQAPVLATDIDHDAALKAQENINLNCFDSLINTIQSDGFQNLLLKSSAPYDLMIANILAEPLIQLAPQFPQYCKKGCVIVLSGLLATQKNAVEHAYLTQGFTTIATHDYGEWSVLQLQI